MARDDFKGQSGGGGLDDFTFEITDAYFGESAALTEKAGRAIMLIHLIGKTDDEAQPILDHDGFHPSYALADGWITTDGGKTVTYDGTSKKPNPRLGAKYGAFLDSAYEITENIAESDEDPFGGAADPHVAETWIGTKWHFVEEMYSYDFTNDAGERIKGSKGKLVPDQYLGRFQVGATPSAATSTTSASSAVDNGLRPAVEALAKSSEDYPTFQKAALALPGISDDPVLLTEVAREDGIYATVNA